jgi:hypothetical protein
MNAEWGHVFRDNAALIGFLAGVLYFFFGTPRSPRAA